MTTIHNVISYPLPRKTVSESVATRFHFDASPETVWGQFMFYEEVPGRPPFLLRILLPYPVATKGDKSSVGALVQCVYEGGNLVKRITAVEPPRLVRFEVIEQHLGIERRIITLGGSCEIWAVGDGADIVLTTNYRAFLRPRGLWRLAEKFLVGQLHGHILSGMRAAIAQTSPALQPALAECLSAETTPPGGLACTSRSHSRR